MDELLVASVVVLLSAGFAVLVSVDDVAGTCFLIGLEGLVDVDAVVRVLEDGIGVGLGGVCGVPLACAGKPMQQTSKPTLKKYRIIMLVIVCENNTCQVW